MQLDLFTDEYLNSLNHPYNDRTVIRFEEVIAEYGITNLSAEKSINTGTGKPIDYSDSNYRWVKCQIDYFNSGFTDKKAWKDFLEIIFRWFYNFGFKRWRKSGKGSAVRREKIKEWAVDAMLCFSDTYQKRVNLVRHFRNEIPQPTDRNAKKWIGKGLWLSENREQFRFIFQAMIGSLSLYAQAVDFIDDDMDEKNLSLDSLYENFDSKTDSLIISRW